ncbi:FMN-binding protein [Acidiferrimicrobium sp. IK]|uniref:FMN-binding protein n=1 Tax=Acidiferrimicrobium sp. IK TaxID=2871700 RepID=UPI0021CB4B7D|nr:FMN-binding protein [Acidiferrimicrobium sp. IK]MCU4186819.1 FMN-binding protein [Acidiferrimicrobium sp. IK]
MRRYPLVIAGTVAGTAAVLAFPVHKPALTISSASATTSTAGGSAAGSATPTTTPSAAAPSTAAPSSATRGATGTDEQFRYGDIAVKVTVQGTKITNVGIATISETDGRSQSIDSYAVPQLEQQVINAGSANINGVSGATYTSQAFYDSLTSALKKLGIS